MLEKTFFSKIFFRGSFGLISQNVLGHSSHNTLFHKILEYILMPLLLKAWAGLFDKFWQPQKDWFKTYSLLSDLVKIFEVNVLLGFNIKQDLNLHQYTTSKHMKHNAITWVTHYDGWLSGGSPRYNMVLAAGHLVITWYSRRVTTL